MRHARPARKPSASVSSRSASTTSEVEQRALQVAVQLAGGAQQAIRWTKHTLNHWYRAQSAVFDASLAYEFLGFTLADAGEGRASLVEKRPAHFAGPTSE